MGAILIKWNGDYSAKTQRVFGLVIGFVVGVLLTVVVLGILWKWGVVKDAKLWEILSAAGTIFAALASSFAAFVAIMAFKFERENTVAKQTRIDDAFRLEVRGAVNSIVFKIRHIINLSIQSLQGGAGLAIAQNIDSRPKNELIAFEFYRAVERALRSLPSFDLRISNEVSTDLMSDVMLLSSVIDFLKGASVIDQYIFSDFLEANNGFDSVVGMYNILAKSLRDFELAWSGVLGRQFNFPELDLFFEKIEWAKGVSRSVDV